VDLTQPELKQLCSKKTRMMLLLVGQWKNCQDMYRIVLTQHAEYIWESLVLG